METQGSEEVIEEDAARWIAAESNEYCMQATRVREPDLGLEALQWLIHRQAVALRMRACKVN
jgi:hypothetical protein